MEDFLYLRNSSTELQILGDSLTWFEVLKNEISDSKKPAQTVVLYHHWGLSRFFELRFDTLDFFLACLYRNHFTVHAVVLKWLMNQFEPVQQSRQQVYPNINTVTETPEIFSNDFFYYGKTLNDTKNPKEDIQFPTSHLEAENPFRLVWIPSSNVYLFHLSKAKRWTLLVEVFYIKWQPILIFVSGYFLPFQVLP